jgi:hypothetical protein
MVYLDRISELTGFKKRLTLIRNECRGLDFFGWKQTLVAGVFQPDINGKEKTERL